MPKQVSYTILEDMEKYIIGFNSDDYERGNFTDSSVIQYLKDYYDTHLPVDVTAWIRVNVPSPELIFGKGCGDQVCFVRDELNQLLRTSYQEWTNNPPLVIATHHSKSVKLPVFLISLKDYGISIVISNNFYEWIVSVKSEKPLDFDFMGTINPSEVVKFCYGFPIDWIFGCYEDNHSQFTFSIRSKYDLYAFFLLLKNYLGIKKEK